MFKACASISILLIAYCLLGEFAVSQEFRKDTRNRDGIEDSNNNLQVNEVSRLDLLQALEVAGIRIQKFQLGKFRKEYDLEIFAEEFKDGKLVNSDHLHKGKNTYIYYLKDGNKEGYFDYVYQIKFETIQDGNSCKVAFSLPTVRSMGKTFEIERTSKDQFIGWRHYRESQWQLGKKVPLLVMASSWKDKQHGFERFCGVATLKEGEAETAELLDASPHYFKFSYLVKESEAKQ